MIAENILWYSEASLMASGHVYCAGSLAQCVRKWTSLAEETRALTHIKILTKPGGPDKLLPGEIASLAKILGSIKV